MPFLGCPAASCQVQESGRIEAETGPQDSEIVLLPAHSLRCESG